MQTFPESAESPVPATQGGACNYWTPACGALPLTPLPAPQAVPASTTTTTPTTPTTTTTTTMLSCAIPDYACVNSTNFCLGGYSMLCAPGGWRPQAQRHTAALVLAWGTEIASHSGGTESLPPRSAPPHTSPHCPPGGPAQALCARRCLPVRAPAPGPERATWHPAQHTQSYTAGTGLPAMGRPASLGQSS